MRNNNNANPRRGAARFRRLSVCLLTAVVAVVTVGIAFAGDTERRQAKRMYDRLAGVPPTAVVLDQMEPLMSSSPEAAAQIAMDDPSFYNVTLKNFAMPWSNEAQDVFAPLNDYVATIIGIVRDNVPFDEALYGDIIYVGSDTNAPSYSNSSNAHYEYLENNNVNLKTDLVQRLQSQVTGLPSSATAGVITTRAAARAFFIDGTNRAMFRFTMINHLCTDLDKLKDTSRDPGRIRQDVSRSPGGDSRIFMNNCAGCHAAMDPMVQAFAYYDYQYPAGNEDGGQLVYTPGSVRPKYLINADTFKYGYITPDDHWDNYWRYGPNSALGWDASLPGNGTGAKSLGRELASSEAFATCQVQKVYKTVCLRDPAAADAVVLDDMVTTFKSNYNLKTVFAKAAVACMGD